MPRMPKRFNQTPIEMIEKQPVLPFESPVIPLIMTPESRLRFSCHQGISRFNTGCKQADIALTPYDLGALKRHPGMTFTEFPARHSAPREMETDKLPRTRWRTMEEAPECLFRHDEGRSVSAGLLRLGSRPVKQVPFKEQTIPMVESAIDSASRNGVDVALWRTKQNKVKREASAQEER